MGKLRTFMTNGTIQKQVNSNDLNLYLQQGWKVGRLNDAWNKGLTKADPRVAKNAEHSSATWANKTEDEIAIWKKTISEATRGHKLSPETIAKRSQSCKGFKPSQEQREKTSAALKGHAVSEETRLKISAKNKGRKGHPCSEECKKRLSEIHSSPEYQERQNRIKKTNGTLNISKPELKAFAALLDIYKDNVVHSYRDPRYPFNCDFYIKSEDLFIELNLTWTHGGAPYDQHNPNHKDKLKLWKRKALSSDFYKNAIYTWTQLDVKKQLYARQNNLNYLMFYTENDFWEWLNSLT